MIDKKFIINLQGKDFVLFEGLLNEFHKNGGNEIQTKMINEDFDSPVFKASVKGDKGHFIAHGDADDNNVNSMIAKHKVRMAETRAIARALRLYNNIGMTSTIELGGDDDFKKQKEKAKAEAKEVTEGSKCEDCGADMALSQKGSLYCSRKCWLK